MSSFEYDFDVEAVVGSAFGVFFAVYAIVILIALAVAAVSYVLQSLSLYTIANRRGIKNPWLAWVPVGNYWVTGCVSDQYRYVAKGEVKNKRKALLILNIVLLVLELSILVYDIDMFITYGGAVSENAAVAAGLMSFVYVIGSLAVFGVSVAISVIYYVALYDLYRSCDPGNGVVYLLLSIFVGWITPILLMIVRKKDEGMPPRKADVATTAPRISAMPQVGSTPAREPWEKPAAEQEPWNQTETEE